MISSCFTDLTYKDNNYDTVDIIPDMTLKILKNKFKNIRNNNKFSKICGVLRKNIITFEAEGLGFTSVEETLWANQIIESCEDI